GPRCATPAPSCAWPPGGACRRQRGRDGPRPRASVPAIDLIDVAVAAGPLVVAALGLSLVDRLVGDAAAGALRWARRLQPAGALAALGSLVVAEGATAGALAGVWAAVCLCADRRGARGRVGGGLPVRRRGRGPGREPALAARAGAPRARRPDARRRPGLPGGRRRLAGGQPARPAPVRAVDRPRAPDRRALPLRRLRPAGPRRRRAGGGRLAGQPPGARLRLYHVGGRPAARRRGVRARLVAEIGR